VKSRFTRKFLAADQTPRAMTRAQVFRAVMENSAFSFLVSIEYRSPFGQH